MDAKGQRSRTFTFPTRTVYARDYLHNEQLVKNTTHPFSTHSRKTLTQPALFPTR